jgi:Trk-type K+ transport system membrane component
LPCLLKKKELLEKTFVLAEENNKILRKMHRSAVWASVFRVIYWIVIIGASIGVYYYIEPYVNQIEGLYKSAKTSIDTINTSSNALMDGLNGVKLPR